MGSEPVCIVPHDLKWADDFANEAKAIIAAIGAAQLRLHHIGSTAIPDIYAKPIIDILGCARDIDNFRHFDRDLAILGYEAMGAYGIKGRLYYRKYHETGVKSHHLHIFGQDSPHIVRHLAFRDYLRHHPEIARQYSDIKVQAALVNKQDMDGYIAAKSPFIEAIQAIALTENQARPAP